VIFHPYGEKKPWSSLDKILHWEDIRDVITLANFGVDRFGGFSVARGQILGFSIDFLRRPNVRVCENEIDFAQVARFPFTTLFYLR